MAARPWFKFYSADWRSDTALRTCSGTARALWLEMICLMEEAQPRGHLVLKGQPMQPKQLALLAALSLQETLAGLKELEEAGVFSRTEDGVIFSRKMIREAAVSEAQRARANQRWQGPEDADLFGAGDAVGNAGSDAHMPESRVQSQNPEARSQKGTRAPERPIPDGFPDAEAIAKGEQQVRDAGVDLDVRRQAARFRGHAETNDRRCRNWAAAFRNWIDKSIETAPRLATADGEPQLSPEQLTDIRERRWRFWMEDWKKGNRWDRGVRGAPPDEPGCTVPLSIMAEFGYTPPKVASR